METLLEPGLLIAAGVTVLACIVRGFSGFGAAAMQVPIFAILYGPPQAVATVALLGTLASAQLMPSAVREADWREVLPITVMAWITVPLGSLVLLAIDPDVMRRCISALILVMVLILASGWRYPVRTGPLTAGAAGSLSGAINGATGVGGPPVVLYLLAGPNPANRNRANLITYYTFLNGATFVSLWAHDIVTREIMLRVLAIWPVQIFSLWMGAWLFRHATDVIYRRIALGLLLGSAVLGLVYSP